MCRCASASHGTTGASSTWLLWHFKLVSARLSSQDCSAHVGSMRTLRLSCLYPSSPDACHTVVRSPSRPPPLPPRAAAPCAPLHCASIHTLLYTTHSSADWYPHIGLGLSLTVAFSHLFLFLHSSYRLPPQHQLKGKTRACINRLRRITTASVRRLDHRLHAVNLPPSIPRYLWATPPTPLGSPTSVRFLLLPRRLSPPWCSTSPVRETPRSRRAASTVKAGCHPARQCTPCASFSFSLPTWKPQ